MQIQSWVMRNDGCAHFNFTFVLITKPEASLPTLRKQLNNNLEAVTGVTSDLKLFSANQHIHSTNLACDGIFTNVLSQPP
jgi:hypothetical protein